jgi:hypothetical protein
LGFQPNFQAMAARSPNKQEVDTNEDFVPHVDEATTYQPHANGEEERNMNVLRDSIADGLMAMWQ